MFLSSSSKLNSTEDPNSKENHNIFQIVIYVLLYLLFIFIAQAWITTFIGYYQKYVIKKKEPDPQDFLILSILLTSIFVIAVYLIRPMLPLFK